MNDSNGIISNKARSTIKDVARLAGVAISVVSYVLNDTPGKSITEETRGRVMEAAAALRYTPSNIARSMRSSKSYCIAVVSFWEVDQHVFVEVLTSALSAANENGYNIIVFEANKANREFAYIEAFRRKAIDGVIVISPYLQSQSARFVDEHIPEIKRLHIPTVVVNTGKPIDTADSEIHIIPLLFRQSVHMAVRQAVALGHREIGYLSCTLSDLDAMPSRERMAGFIEAMADNGLNLRDEWIYSLNDMTRFFKDSKQRNIPSMLIIEKALEAHSFLVACSHNKFVIPDDVSVIVCNFEPYVPFSIPTLTSVTQPLRSIGNAAALKLIDDLQGAGAQARQLPEPQCTVLVGDSVRIHE